MSQPPNPFERLCRAVSEDDEDPALVALFSRLMEDVSACLVPEQAAVWEEIVDSMGRAAEELSDDATTLEIRDRARLIRRQRN